MSRSTSADCHQSLVTFEDSLDFSHRAVVVLIGRAGGGGVKGNFES